MKITFVPNGWEDYRYWQKTDRKLLGKINRLVDDITCGDPYSGIGKPEPLRHHLFGACSRRITDEHRLVYLIDDDALIILAARYHYEQ
ncbi:MAG TPA: Txe/YoeB family addiction module toxin [Mycobacteriales bacterium]|nr:Txe/YoeB family addiction module toxin [Mycobacteriales bacterium]